MKNIDARHRKCVKYFNSGLGNPVYSVRRHNVPFFPFLSFYLTFFVFFLSYLCFEKSKSSSGKGIAIKLDAIISISKVIKIFSDPYMTIIPYHIRTNGRTNLPMRTVIPLKNDFRLEENRSRVVDEAHSGVNKTGKKNLNFRLARDQVVLPETAATLCASHRQVNDFFAVFFSSFELG